MIDTLVPEKITIEDFNDKKFKIRFFEPFENKSAVVTHYLQNKGYAFEEPFKEDAYFFTTKLLEYKQNTFEVLPNATEQALQYFLFQQNKTSSIRIFLLQSAKNTVRSVLFVELR